MMANPYTGSDGGDKHDLRQWQCRENGDGPCQEQNGWYASVFVSVLMFVFAVLTLNLDSIVNGSRLSSDQVNTQDVDTNTHTYAVRTRPISQGRALHFLNLKAVGWVHLIQLLFPRRSGLISFSCLYWGRLISNNHRYISSPLPC